MTRPLKGKVGVVAGRGIACMLGEAGATVYCTGRSVRGRLNMTGYCTVGKEVTWRRTRSPQMRRQKEGAGRSGVASPLQILIIAPAIRSLFVRERGQALGGTIMRSAPFVLTLSLLLSPVPAAPAADGADAPKMVFVVNTQEASVSLVDLATMKQVNRYPVGDRPYGIAICKDGKTIAVGVEGEECVKFFSLPDFKLKGKTAIGKMFNDHIVLSQDGKHVLVANFYSDDVVGIAIESMKEAFRIKDCSAPHVVKYGPLKKQAFVTCKKVTGIAVIDPDAGKLVKFIGMNVNPRSLTFSPDEKKVYFGSFWVDGFFEMEVDSGKVTRLFKYDPPKEAADPQEVTYHGVEMLTDKVLVAANEGRSYIDAVDVTSGALLDRLTDVSKPCCVERIPGTSGRFLISNLADGTLQLAELTAEGKLKSLGKAKVGKAPKRVAFLPHAPPWRHAGDGRGAERAGRAQELAIAQP